MDRTLIENIFNLFVVIIFLLISWKDLKEKIIPNFFVLGIIFLKLLKIIFLNENFEKSFLGLGVFPIILILIYGYISDFLKKEIIGFGDIKLVGAIGFYLGYSGIYNFIIFHNIIFILSFLFVLPMIFIKRLKKEKEIPFAPFICLGTIIYKIFMVIAWKKEDIFLWKL